MTTKEMLTNVINGTVTEEVKTKAAEMLKKAEEKTGKRAEQSAKNRTENKAIAEYIISKMDDDKEYAANELLPLATEEYPDIKTAKIVAVMAIAVEDGLIKVNKEYKVGGKGRKVNGYSKTTTTEIETEIENETTIE